MLALFFTLLLAHILGDFVLQTSKGVAHKEAFKHRSIYLYLHIIVHACCMAVLLLLVNIGYIWIIIPIIISHYIIDLAKLHLQTKSNATILFFADQLLHLITIAGLAAIATHTSIPTSVIFNYQTVLFTSLLLMATNVSSIAMRFLLLNWDVDIDSENETKSLKSAGKYIGLLERLLVFVFVILNQWSAIGFLIAAKSAFRFGDLSEAKNRKLTEYMLIGTLLSFGLALFFGVLYVRLK